MYLGTNKLNNKVSKFILRLLGNDVKQTLLQTVAKVETAVTLCYYQIISASFEHNFSINGPVYFA